MNWNKKNSSKLLMFFFDTTIAKLLLFLLYICHKISYINCQDISSNYFLFENLSPDSSQNAKIFNESVAEITFHKQDINVLQHSNFSVNFTVTPLTKDFDNSSDVQLYLQSSDKNILNVSKLITIYLKNIEESYIFSLISKIKGHAVLLIENNSTEMIETTRAFVRVNVYQSEFLEYFSDIVGWFYFLAWSISFYPQIILNWKRKSVIGLNFDFLSLNTIGFFLYSIFNIGFYGIPIVEEEYLKRHPFGVNPVQINDVVFSVHAFVACLIQICQCYGYERGDQKISRTARSFLSSFIIIVTVLIILSSCSVLYWIDTLYLFSYIKLFITLIKYIPQAYFNYIRKSTSGWSIGNIILDFTGGLFSILQMFLISANYDDWSSIFGDPAKFGLGLISIMFDIVFIIQHYVLYSEHNVLESILVAEDSPISRVGSSTYGTVQSETPE